MGDVKKIAILGGGVGAMTAAWWLTEKSDPATTQYDITVYQLGWRLGGKGASGRNMTPGYGKRIEEHGLHIWMGFYANAFKIMQKAYAECGRPAGSPLATWDTAFMAHNTVTQMSGTPLGWLPWTTKFPRHGGVPGDTPQFLLPQQWMTKLPPLMREIVDDLLYALTQLVDPGAGGPSYPDVARATLRGTALAAMIEAMCVAAIDVLDTEATHKILHDLAVDAHDILGDLFDVLMPFSSIPEVDGVIRYLYLFDIGLAFIRGFFTDDVIHKGWASINDREWRAWMQTNGLHKPTMWCPYVREVYELLFAFRDGIATPDHADIAAGVATMGVLRMCFEYEGSIFWKMQAGMGDAVFGPLYEVLLKRGVQFKFFNRVREVIPNAENNAIATVTIGVQATVRQDLPPYDPTPCMNVPVNPGGYNPLICVNDLPCWPSTPLYDQLVQGDQLRDWNIDLEDYAAHWMDVETTSLEAGIDFDWLVFGLSLGAVKKVCPQLVDRNPAWAAMVKNVGTVRTQAFQLWLNKDIKELGWQPAMNGTDGNERAVLGSFVEPLDTWADMSDLIGRETWTREDNVKNIAYFCGPAQEGDDIYGKAMQLMRFDYHWIWRNAYNEIGEFDWDNLVDSSGAKGVDRFASQYFRFNDQPTELYVQSFSNTTQYRIGQDTGYSNLCIVGDWTNNPFPVGCVEGAVIGGMHGIEPITGPLPIVK